MRTILNIEKCLINIEERYFFVLTSLKNLINQKITNKMYEYIFLIKFGKQSTLKSKYKIFVIPTYFDLLNTLNTLQVLTKNFNLLKKI